MVKNPGTPQAPERHSTMPPPKFDKKSLARLMIRRNRRKLMSEKVLPVTSPFADENFYEELKKLAEEEKRKRKEYEALPEAERLKHPELKPNGCEEDHELWKLTEDFFEASTGKDIEELRKLALDDPREIDNMAEKVENMIAKMVPFLSGDLEERKNALRQLSEAADRFYKYYIQFLPEAAQSLRWGTTLTNVDNNVGQLALKFITSKNPRLRHHSKIKLLLMLHLGFVTDHKNERVGFDESLSFFTNFIARSVAYYGQNDEKGCATIKFLKTTHNKKNKKTGPDFSIHNNKKECALKDNERLQQIDVRKAIVTDDKGEQRIIEFVIESRRKDTNSLAEKGLRANRGTIKDHHGMKFICNTSEDVRSLEKLLIERLQKMYFEILVSEYQKVKNRQTSVEQSCEAYSKQLSELSAKKESDEITPEEEIKMSNLVEKLRVAKITIKESIESQERIQEMLKKQDECISIEYSIKEEKRDEDGEVIKDSKGEPIKKERKTVSTNPKEALQKLPDNLDKGMHGGVSKGSSKHFKVRKYYVDYCYPDFKNKKIMPFEWQFQLFDGYVDSQVREEVNEDEFHVNRAFDDGIMELLAPPDVYPEINLEKAKADRLMEIRRRVEDALTHSSKGRRKLIQERRKKSS